jgi:hypothetical protein
LRARGFTIDIAASVVGDLIVGIDAQPTDDDQIAVLAAPLDGRIEGRFGDSGGLNRSPWIVANGTTVADASHGSGQARVDGDSVVRPPSRREKHDALGLLLGMLGILLGLALIAGATLPSAQ